MQNITLSILIGFSILFSSVSLFAQDSKEDRKKAKEERLQAEWQESRDMAESQQYVFSAEQLITNDGTVALDPKINFFYIVDDYAVIQFGFDGVFIGGNGVGGVTTEGTVHKYKVSGDNPKKPVQAELQVQPKAGQGFSTANLLVKFYGEGFGEVHLNASGARLKGQFAKLEDSNIYQGNIR